MKCDDCRAEWECPEKEPDDRCPECGGNTVHRSVSDHVVSRMQAILGQHKTTPERLKAAFVACTTGGEVFADAVLARALETGYIELMDGTVWRTDPKVR